MIKGYTVYVDMDGVLANFKGAMEERFGFNFDTAPDDNDPHSGKNGSAWKAIAEYDRYQKSLGKNVADGKKGWFYSLPEMPDARRLWDFVTSTFEDVKILTASGNTPPDGGEQKRQWMLAHFGVPKNKVIVVGGGAEKANEGRAHPHAILIDDSAKAYEPFAAKGGKIVPHTSAAVSIMALKTMMDLK